jgi:hypothetical protein
LTWAMYHYEGKRVEIAAALCRSYAHTTPI